MELSDRSNWILSGLVGALVAANGVVLVVQWGSTVLLLTAGVAVTLGGGLVLTTAVRALRDPTVVDQQWTSRKTAVNAVAVAVLTVALLSAVLTLRAT